jgi:hypothetical protein
VYRPREFPPRGCAAMTRVATLSLIVPCALLCAAAAFGDWPAAFSSLLARSVFAGLLAGLLALFVVRLGPGLPPRSGQRTAFVGVWTACLVRQS